CTRPKRLSNLSMTTATSPFASGGAVDAETPADMSSAPDTRTGSRFGVDFDRHRHALAQRGVGLIDHDPKAIHQVGTKIGGLHGFGRELGAWRDESDLTLI